MLGFGPRGDLAGIAPDYLFWKRCIISVDNFDGVE
jgi:hypothetical protein